MPPRANLPLELCDIIVGQLCHDNRSLRVCLFVSRYFRHRARCHLFESIRIDDAGKNHTFRAPWTPEEVHHRLELLLTLLVPEADPGSQGILPYIRHLYFGFSLYGLYSISILGSSMFPNSVKCAVDILEIVGAPTSKLQTIEINGQNYPDYGGSWADLVPSIRSSLLHLCRVVSSRITLKWMSKIPKNILRGTTVSHVSLKGVMFFEPNPYYGFNPKIFPEYDEESEIALFSLPILQYAQIDDAFDEFCHLMFPVDKKTSIKALDFVLDLDLGARQTSKKLCKQFPNLEVLTVDIDGYNNDSTIDDFDIRGLVFLKEFTIRVYCSTYRSTYASFLPNLLPSLTSILTRSSASTTLSKISIYLPPLFIDLTSDGSFGIDFNCFSDLDRVMSSLPSLRHFTIASTIHQTLEESQQRQLLQLLRNAFPCLLRSEKVVFELFARFIDPNAIFESESE